MTPLFGSETSSQFAGLIKKEFNLSQARADKAMQEINDGFDELVEAGAAEDQAAGIATRLVGIGLREQK